MTIRRLFPLVVALALIGAVLPGSGCRKSPLPPIESQQRIRQATLDDDPSRPRVNPNQVELDLGEFRISVPQRDSNTIDVLDFQAFAVVRRDRHEALQEKLGPVQQRLRHDVIFSLRRLEPSDLKDPDLRKMRQRILDAVTRHLGKDATKHVGFQRFTHTLR